MKSKPKKSLIVYYSYSGNNRLLAEYLAKEIEADVVAVKEKKKRTAGTILFDVLLKRTPEIEPLALPLRNYDHVIFMSPLWNEKIANPLKALILKERNSIGDYSFVTFSGGYEKKGQLTKVKHELRELIGKSPTKIYEIDAADVFSGPDKRKINTVSSYRLKPDDFNKVYKEKLKNIVNSLSEWLHAEQRRSELESLI